MLFYVIDLIKAKAGPPVVGIGKRGGKIIGYDKKGKPIYQGSKKAEEYTREWFAEQKAEVAFSTYKPIPEASLKSMLLTTQIHFTVNGVRHEVLKESDNRWIYRREGAEPTTFNHAKDISALLAGRKDSLENVVLISPALEGRIYYQKKLTTDELKAQGYPKTAGTVTVNNPGTAVPEGVTWRKGYPGPGFSSTVEYKGGKYRFNFKAGSDGLKVQVTYPGGMKRDFPSPNAAADSMYLFHHKLDLGMSATEKKKRKISMSARRAMGITAFEAALVERKDPIDKTVEQLQEAGEVPADAESIDHAANNAGTMPAATVKDKPFGIGDSVKVKKKGLGEVVVTWISKKLFGVQYNDPETHAPVELEFLSRGSACDHIWAVTNGYKDAADYKAKNNTNKVPSGAGWKFLGIDPKNVVKLTRDQTDTDSKKVDKSEPGWERMPDSEKENPTPAVPNDYPEPAPGQTEITIPLSTETTGGGAPPVPPKVTVEELTTEGVELTPEAGEDTEPPAAAAEEPETPEVPLTHAQKIDLINSAVSALSESKLTALAERYEALQTAILEEKGDPDEQFYDYKAVSRAIYKFSRGEDIDSAVSSAVLMLKRKKGDWVDMLPEKLEAYAVDLLHAALSRFVPEPSENNWVDYPADETNEQAYERLGALYKKVGEAKVSGTAEKYNEMASSIDADAKPDEYLELRALARGLQEFINSKGDAEVGIDTAAMALRPIIGEAIPYEERHARAVRLFTDALAKLLPVGGAGAVKAVRKKIVLEPVAALEAKLDPVKVADRFPDDQATSVLEKIGDYLAQIRNLTLQGWDKHEKEFAGMHVADMYAWQSGMIKGDLVSMRMMLKKYKRQILTHFGEMYYQLGLGEPIANWDTMPDVDENTPEAERTGAIQAWLAQVMSGRERLQIVGNEFEWKKNKRGETIAVIDPETLQVGDHIRLQDRPGVFRVSRVGAAFKDAKTQKMQCNAFVEKVQQPLKEYTDAELGFDIEETLSKRIVTPERRKAIHQVYKGYKSSRDKLVFNLPVPGPEDYPEGESLEAGDVIAVTNEDDDIVFQEVEGFGATQQGPDGKWFKTGRLKYTDLDKPLSSAKNKLQYEAKVSRLNAEELAAYIQSNRDVGMRMVAMRDKANPKEFHFYMPQVRPYVDTFNHIFGPDYEDIAHLSEYRKSTGARVVTNIDVANEFIEAIRKELPDFKIVTDGIDDANKEREEMLDTYRDQIPELVGKLSDGIALLPHQNEGVYFIEKAGGSAIIGDEPGTGKTLTAMAYNVRNEYKTLVVCPKTVRRNWTDEAEKFFSNYYKEGEVVELSPGVVRRKGMPDLSKAKLVSINYESIHKFKDELIAAGFDSFIIDESHMINNTKSRQSLAVTEIAEDIPNKQLLTGTKDVNKQEDSFTQWQLAAPGLFSDKKDMRKMSEGALWNKTANKYIARTKKSVAKYLPDKIKSVVRNYVPGLPDWKTGTDIGEMSKIRQEIAIKKVPVTAAYIKDLLKVSDESILVFTENVASAEALAAELGDNAVLHHGGIGSDDKKEQIKQDWQAGVTPARVFVTTRPSLPAGYTMTRASQVIFNDLPWTTAKLIQAEDRAHRIGQENSVTVTWMVGADNKLEENVSKILKRKTELWANQQNGKKLSPEDRAWMNTDLTLEEVLSGVAARAEAKPNWETMPETAKRDKAKERALKKYLDPSDPFSDPVAIGKDAGGSLVIGLTSAMQEQEGVVIEEYNTATGWADYDQEAPIVLEKVKELGFVSDDIDLDMQNPGVEDKRNIMLKYLELIEGAMQRLYHKPSSFAERYINALKELQIDTAMRLLSDGDLLLPDDFFEQRRQQFSQQLELANRALAAIDDEDFSAQYLVRQQREWQRSLFAMSGVMHNTVETMLLFPDGTFTDPNQNDLYAQALDLDAMLIKSQDEFIKEADYNAAIEQARALTQAVKDRIEQVEEQALEEYEPPAALTDAQKVQALNTLKTNVMEVLELVRGKYTGALGEMLAGDLQNRNAEIDKRLQENNFAGFDRFAQSTRILIQRIRRMIGEEIEEKPAGFIDRGDLDEKTGPTRPPVPKRVRGARFTIGTAGGGGGSVTVKTGGTGKQMTSMDIAKEPDPTKEVKIKDMSFTSAAQLQKLPIGSVIEFRHPTGNRRVYKTKSGTWNLEINFDLGREGGKDADLLRDNLLSPAILSILNEVPEESFSVMVGTGAVPKKVKSTKAFGTTGYVYGSRLEKVRLKKGLSLSNIEDDPDQARAFITKKTLIGDVNAHDFLEDRKNGVSPEAAFFKYTLLKSISPKPLDDPKVRRNYHEMIMLLENSLSQVRSVEDIEDFRVEWQNWLEGKKVVDRISSNELIELGFGAILDPPDRSALIIDGMSENSMLAERLRFVSYNDWDTRESISNEVKAMFAAKYDADPKAQEYEAARERLDDYLEELHGGEDIHLRNRLVDGVMEVSRRMTGEERRDQNADAMFGSMGSKFCNLFGKKLSKTKYERNTFTIKGKFTDEQLADLKKVFNAMDRGYDADYLEYLDDPGQAHVFKDSNNLSFEVLPDGSGYKFSTVDRNLSSYMRGSSSYATQRRAQFFNEYVDYIRTNIQPEETEGGEVIKDGGFIRQTAGDAYTLDVNDLEYEARETNVTYSTFNEQLEKLNMLTQDFLSENVHMSRFKRESEGPTDEDIEKAWEWAAPPEPKKKKSKDATKTDEGEEITGANKYHRIFKNRTTGDFSRVGPPIPELDSLTSDMLKEAFNMKEIEYGKSQTLADQEWHSKAAYTALSDLAGIMNIDLKDVSYNGRISLAFGSRGNSTGLAHYEPGTKVINLTNYKGNGSLAHEMAHAIDNITHIVYGIGRGQNVTDLAVENDVALNVLPPRILGAFKNVMSVITKGEAYVSSPDDFKAVIGAEIELAEKDGRGWYANRMREALGQAQAGEIGWERLREYLPSGTETDYFRHARRMGAYWVRPHELFARCFAAYVQDKLESTGRKNTYLVHGSEYVEDFPGYNPGGEHRERINAAMDRLMQVLSEDTQLKKAFTRFFIRL